MHPSLLITQCLQNDFVKPIGRYDPIPNRLHVGFSEAQRLMGEKPSEGPLARTMRWANGMPDDKLNVIHIRDWHDPDDSAQMEHLDRFGPHCIKGTTGAAVAFQTETASDKDIHRIDSLTLNDFHGTRLQEILSPYASEPCRIGIIGVWTEAKVSFLAYELRTRYPHFDLAVCSALTASSSRQHHFAALERLGRILGVRVFDSVGEFLQFLGGKNQHAPLLGMRDAHPELTLEGTELDDADETLVRYLFRDCRSVQLKTLSGGYSGNVVAGAESVDSMGHEQVPHVVKIGPRELMGKERTAFERVQEVLGNNAPQIRDFADFGERGAIKYRYASMGGSFSTTFQKQYMGEAPLTEIQRILDSVFGEKLMRLYKAATLEDCDMLAHYAFDSRWAPSVREKVESLLGGPAASRVLELLPGEHVHNVCDFYEDTLVNPAPRPGDRCYQAYVHGDLNGANIVLDGHRNVWLIDFFHTRRAHVLMDLIKLENDLLYIFTEVGSDEELRAAFRLSDALMAVRDLAEPLPEESPVDLPQFKRAWTTVRMLRLYYAQLVHSDRHPFQLWVAQLRYAVHTLGFDESTALQKRWALYTAGLCVEKIRSSLNRSTELRLDWIDDKWTSPGRVALTFLPGRRDYGRSLERDLAVLTREGVQRVLCLATTEELERHGVSEFLPSLRDQGMKVLHMPMLDQMASSVEDMRRAIAWVEEGLTEKEKVLMHCVGGLGRSGTAAAVLLRTRGASAAEALEEVRRARSPRAVETSVQEAFIRDYPA